MTHFPITVDEILENGHIVLLEPYHYKTFRVNDLCTYDNRVLRSLDPQTQCDANRL